MRRRMDGQQAFEQLLGAALRTKIALIELGSEDTAMILDHRSFTIAYDLARRYGGPGLETSEFRDRDAIYSEFTAYNLSFRCFKETLQGEMERRKKEQQSLISEMDIRNFRNKNPPWIV